MAVWKYFEVSERNKTAICRAWTGYAKKDFKMKRSYCMHRSAVV